jgi:hypothetical protein
MDRASYDKECLLLQPNLPHSALRALLVGISLPILPVNEPYNGHLGPLGINVAREHRWTLVPPRGPHLKMALRRDQP